MALDRTLPALAPMGRLCLLVPFGAAVYAALLLLFARPLVEEMLALVRMPRPAARAA